MNQDNIRPALQELVEATADRHRTAEDRVADVVRSALGSGLFRPGDRLPQDTLAKLLDVSRMPVRAALRQLESEGLVELLPHRGAVVRSLSPDELEDLYEMRILLETYALRRSVTAMTPESVAGLEDLARQMDEAESLREWLELQDEFYRTLYTVGNSPRAVTLIMQFRAEVRIHISGFRHRSGGEHRPLLEHIRQNDPGYAASWLETHLRGVVAAKRDEAALQKVVGKS